MKHHLPITGRLPLLLGPVLIIIAATSCDTWPKSHLKIPLVTAHAYQEYKTDVEEKKSITQTKCVIIDGDDIQLPMTSGNLAPQENRFYSFYIWAYNPEEGLTNSLETMRENGTFNVEVVGVKAAISVPDYLPAAGPPQQLLTGVTNGMTRAQIDSLKSRHVLEVRVRSQDITKSFSIVAWFPEKYLNWLERNTNNLIPYQLTKIETNELAQGIDRARPFIPTTSLPSRPVNPWGERRNIKVYNGDLRTRIDIVDEREAQASFGKPFADHFYVGRVYLRNRHQDKRLVVYTTSLRANLLFYRPPIGELNDKQLDLSARQKSNYNSKIEKQLNAAKSRLNETELNLVLAKAFEQSASEMAINLVARHEDATNLAVKLLPVESTAASPTNDYLRTKREEATLRIESVWQLIKQTSEGWENEAVTLRSEAERMGKNAVDATRRFHGPHQSVEAYLAFNLQRMALDDYFNLTPDYLKTTNAIGTSNLRPKERQWLLEVADQIYAKRYEAIGKSMLAQALRNNAPQDLYNSPPPYAGNAGPVSLRKQYDLAVANIRYLASGGGHTGNNPFATARDILVNPGARALAFSESSDRQLSLDTVGYLWHDTYRPMTFQAVLNSLIFTHENSWSAHTAAFLDAAAAVAGGMVGIGTAINEFNSKGYLEGVSIFSTLLVPQTKKLILDDLNKHIRNLGDLGMDTVVVIPPNDVVDHYIFFPKGPIYNFVDEFDIQSPSYLKNIDNDDVGVEATLINQGVNVQGGGLDAGTLVGRALNEGQTERSTELAKEAALLDNLRDVKLAILESDIDKNLARTDAGTNGVKSQARILAEKTICKEVKEFRAQFGQASDSILNNLLNKYQVNCDDAPPVINYAAVPTIHVLGDLCSQPFVMPVSDSMGIWNLKITNTTDNALFLPPENVKVQLPAQNSSDPVRFTVQATTNAASQSEAKLNVTFAISNTLALSASLAVKVTTHAPQFILQPQQDTAMWDGKKLILPRADQRAFVTVSFPIYNSTDGADWTFAPDRVLDATNGWAQILEPTPQINTGGGMQTLMTSLIIDASLAQTNSFPIVIKALHGTNVIATTNIQAVVLP
jgi:hypothetical protein